MNTNRRIVCIVLSIVAFCSFVVFGGCTEQEINYWGKPPRAFSYYVDPEALSTVMSDRHDYLYPAFDENTVVLSLMAFFADETGLTKEQKERTKRDKYVLYSEVAEEGFRAKLSELDDELAGTIAERKNNGLNETFQYGSFKNEYGDDVRLDVYVAPIPTEGQEDKFYTSRYAKHCKEVDALSFGTNDGIRLHVYVISKSNFHDTRDSVEKVLYSFKGYYTSEIFLIFSFDYDGVRYEMSISRAMRETDETNDPTGEESQIGEKNTVCAKKYAPDLARKAFEILWSKAVAERSSL